MTTKIAAALLISATALFACSTPRPPSTGPAIAACRTIPRVAGHYAERAQCELAVEARAYLAKQPDMANTWGQLIESTLAEYVRADQGEQTIEQADANAALLRKAAETGTGCLTDDCGTGSPWHFPDAPPY